MCFSTWWDLQVRIQREKWLIIHFKIQGGRSKWTRKDFCRLSCPDRSIRGCFQLHWILLIQFIISGSLRNHTWHQTALSDHHENCSLLNLRNRLQCRIVCALWNFVWSKIAAFYDIKFCRNIVWFAFNLEIKQENSITKRNGLSLSLKFHWNKNLQLAFLIAFDSSRTLCRSFSAS